MSKAALLNIAELKQRHLEGDRPVPRAVIASLKADTRGAARAFLKNLAAKQAANRSEGQRLRHMLAFETELRALGHVHIAGVDEAGVGPCAGPVVAGAAILPVGYKLKGLDDSKKILSEEHRDELAAAVKRDALAWCVAFSTVEEIDTINIYQAGLLAMRRAVEGLKVAPDFVLVDARKIPGLTMPQRGLIGGDGLSLSIAAGAILAKTTRDAHMRELHARFPRYAFATHKGYPTPQHLKALQKFGPVDCHRRSFAPVKRALGLIPEQEELQFDAPPRKKSSR